jgi:hypothetical protein
MQRSKELMHRVLVRCTRSRTTQSARAERRRRRPRRRTRRAGGAGSPGPGVPPRPRAARAQVKFNVNRVDNMVIQAIALLDTLDKDINTFVMRVREWYSWHFPELVRVVSDNYLYARLTLLIRDKAALSEAMLPGAA